IKYRLYPTTEQEIYFSKCFGCCRKIWNLMLCDREKSYKETGKSVKNTPASYKSEYPYLKEVDSLALANVYLDLELAYKSFFNKKSGYPKFKSLKKSRKSYTTNNQNGTIAITDNAIKLPKAGFIKAKVHRQPKSNWKLKSATVFQTTDGLYFVSVIFEYEENIDKTINFDNCIGLDYKSDGLYMDSFGNVGDNHKFYHESHKKLAKEQRRLSRKIGSKKNEKKSTNYLKQLKKVNKIHRHIANQRLDNLHKKSNEIANRYDVVCVENLNMRNMSNKGFRNGKATMDNGYGMFLNFLAYKLNDRGKYFVKVDKWYPSSQICSVCGSKKKLALNERTYICECGNTIDRDLNAAINIKREGLRLLKEMVA
ncbi:MAG: transposase, partial [Finegoldia magna]|nr:transposase [Finegoldia magna]